MKRSVQLFLWVLSISFTGSLPPGTLNTGVTDLVVNGGAFAAIQFGLGAILVEVAFVRVVLAGMSVLKGTGRVLRWGSVMGVVVMLLLAIISFKGALYKGWGGVPLVSGILLSFLNPLHLPFWMGWAAVLRSKRVLGDTVFERNVFAGAVGLGTAFAFFVYGLTGHLFIRWLQINKGLLNWLIGLTLLTAGVMQLRRVILSIVREQ